MMSGIIGVLLAAVLLTEGDSAAGPAQAPRIAPLPSVAWDDSEWIAVSNAAVVDAAAKRRERSADGTSCFRRRVTNGQRVVAAKWMTAGLGVYDLYLNGVRVGDDFLKPGFTHGRKTKYAFTYDVTKLLRTEAGQANDFGAEVGAGWWRDRIVGYVGRKSAFRCVIELTYADGTKELVGTKAAEWFGEQAGPITHSGIYDGEEFDARQTNGARAPRRDFTPGGCERNDEFSGELLPTAGAEICLRWDLAMSRGPVSVRAGETVVIDFGQNCAAVPFFRFRAKRGTRLTILPGEMLNDDDKGQRGCDGPKGSVFRLNLRNPDNVMRFSYVFAGGGWETYLPRFSYAGYRYVSLSATGDVEIEQVASVPVTSIAQAMETGRIETGVKEVNQLIANVQWSQRSNYLSVPTDCPQRNERLGWSADAQIFSETALYNADVVAFLRKFMRDERDSVCSDGGFPSAAPASIYGADTFNFGWADAGVIIPYRAWQMSGDRQILAENYAAMARFVRRLDEVKYDFEGKLDYMWSDWLSFEPFESCGNRFGDWTKWQRHPDAMNYRRFLAACFWRGDALMLSAMAEALGQADDADWFRQSAERALAYLRAKFVAADGLLLEPMRGLQTACVFALTAGVLAAEGKAATKAILLRSLREHGDCLQTGILGTSRLMDALTDNDLVDVAYTLLLQRKNPSWLYSVDQGATTIWERWDSYTAQDGFSRYSGSMNSFNHYAYGAVVAWLYRVAAGIAPDPKNPGFRHLVLRPRPDRRLGRVTAEYQSPCGLIKSAWHYDGAKWIWHFTVPNGVTASVILPGEAAAEYAAGAYRIERPAP